MIDPEVSRLKFARAIEQLNGVAEKFVKDAKWDVVKRDYPLFEVVWLHPRSARRVGFRFRFEHWDAMPPRLELFDPSSGTLLTWSQWPKGGWAVGEAHPTTKTPFLCLPGIREYHDHPSHLADLWSALRERDSYSMLYLIERVQQKFEASDG